VIDDRGRLFGRMNLIDALVGLLALGLVPLVYGAFLLFRVPAPKITSLSPTTVTAGQPATVQIVGEELRPFLRVGIGSQDVPFLIQSPTSADIKVPALAPGTYDLILYDEAQELARVPGALAVVPAPSSKPLSVEVQAVGAFVAIDEGGSLPIEAGSKLTRPNDAVSTASDAIRDEPVPIAEVLALRPPEPSTQPVRAGSSVVTATVPGERRVPAVLRLTCAVVGGQCNIGDTVVAPGTSIPLSLLHRHSTDDPPERRSDPVQFLVEELRPPGTRPEFPETLPLNPPIELQLAGAFIGVPPDQAARIARIGARFDRQPDAEATAGSGRRIEGLVAAEVLAVKPATARVQRVRVGDAVLTVSAPDELQVPAILRLICVVVNEECRVGPTPVGPDRTITLQPSSGGPSGSAPSAVQFLIQEVRLADAPMEFPTARAAVATVRVRFTAVEEMLDLIKVGDLDIGRSATAVGVNRAVLIEIGSDRQTVLAETETSVLDRSYVLQGRVVVFTGTVRVPVVFTPSGWDYKGRPVKVGGSFQFETVSGAISGWILDVQLDEETHLTR